VTGVDEVGNVLCAAGPDLSLIQTQIQALQAQVEALQKQSVSSNIGGGVDVSGPTFSFVIPQSEFGGFSHTALLTVRAIGNQVILARTFLVHTGDLSGVVVSEIGPGGSYSAGVVEVTGNLQINQYESMSDGLRGVTVSFSQMPATFTYRYKIVHIGDLY
jgi:hypothetical protein